MKMNWKKFFIATSMSFSLMLPAVNAQVVTVQGSGISESAAIQDAKRTAVEKVVGTMIKSDSMMVDLTFVYDAINSRTQGYVNSCEIIDKKNSDGLVNITARIDVSAEPNSSLMKDVELVMNLNDPRLAVVMEHYGDDGGETFKRYSEMCAAAIRKELTKRGFTHVVENPMNIDYIIVGNLTVGKDKNISLPSWRNISDDNFKMVDIGLKKSQAVMDCKIKKFDTDEIIGEFHATGQNINSAAADELDNRAVIQMAESAAKNVREIFNREASKVFSSVKVFVNSNDAEKIMQLEEILRQTQGVTSVYIRNFSNGKCIADVATGLSPQNLYRVLSATAKDNFKLNLKNFSSTTLEISID